jgi:hypothetical protein
MLVLGGPLLRFPTDITGLDYKIGYWNFRKLVSLNIAIRKYSYSGGDKLPVACICEIIMHL